MIKYKAGKRFNYTIENGIQNVDFVIDMDGNLHIGRGHSYLAGGSSVQAMNYPTVLEMQD